MTRLPTVSAAAAALFVLLTPSAYAEPGSPICAERTSLISQLETRHGEVRRSVGLQQNSGVIETYANAETGSWTIIITLPTGLSCLVAVGENWREEDAALNAPDDAA